MIKKVVCILLIVLLSFPLSGCWNYVGLNQIAIVTGIAIDQNTADGNYQLTFEIVDLTTSSKEGGVKSKIVESQGETVFDAIRNAKKRLLNKLFFSSTEIIVISSKIAREQGINSIIDFFIRDAEPRENLHLIVSQEATAKDFIVNNGIVDPIAAFEVSKIIDKDSRITASTKDVPLYKVFGILKDKGISLVLPAFHCVTNDKEKVPEANGIAVFKKDKLLGYLTADETRYYLLTANAINGGVLTCSLVPNQHDTISLEIKSNKTKIIHSYSGNQVSIVIKTQTEVYLDEAAIKVDNANEQELDQIKKAAEAKIKQNITELLRKVQSEFDSDIFGFGNQIYKTDSKLWNEVGENWDDQFKKINFVVEPEVEILNTGSLKSN